MSPWSKSQRLPSSPTHELSLVPRFAVTELPPANQVRVPSVMELETLLPAVPEGSVDEARWGLVQLCRELGGSGFELERLAYEDLRRLVLEAVAAEQFLLLELERRFGGALPQPKPKPDEPPKPAPEPEKSLLARWNVAKAFCGDEVILQGTGENLGTGVAAQGKLTLVGKGELPTLEGKGDTAFSLPWPVKDVIFEKGDPPHLEVEASLEAGGLSAAPPKPLEVFRLPDIATKSVTIARTAGKYAWTGAFRVRAHAGAIHIDQTLEIEPAWLGKWVNLDATKDKTKIGWAFIKKAGGAWQYWDTGATPAAWTALPRGIDAYTVNSLFFVKTATGYVARDNAATAWPESFSTPANLETKKAAWLKNIHDTWDRKFKVHRKGCKSSKAGCCTWKLKVKVVWSDKPGDKKIYAVWAQDWERSNAKDWYLTEERLGVAAHEGGHLLGAYDEYTGGAVDPVSNKIEENSIMGQNLAKGFPRHLDGLRDEVAKIVNSAVHRHWKLEIKDA
jgi:hypothetical protein